MAIRPAERPTDLPAIAALTSRYETAWFGVPEQDEDEVTETLERIADWSHDIRLAEAAGRLCAAAWRWQQDLDLLVDPSAVDAGPQVRQLIDWLASGPDGQLQVLDRDEQLRTWLADAGWTQVRSAFELTRDVSDGWSPAPPRWPADVDLVEYRPEHAAAVHRLVYVDAGWSHVQGHNDRDLAEWQTLFLAEQTNPCPPVVAWRGSRPVGVALSRTFGDGTGWINQLAVAQDARGAGLGRALLLDALGRLRAGGARRLALGVQAANSGALDLYLGCGLRMEREYLYYASPAGG